MDSGGDSATPQHNGASARSAPPPRKRNRKSRAKSAAGTSSSSTSGGDQGIVGTLTEASAPPDELDCLVIDVVCGINRAKLRVDGLRNGSKTACVYLETDQLDQGHAQGQTKGQTRTGEI